LQTGSTSVPAKALLSGKKAALTSPAKPEASYREGFGPLSLASLARSLAPTRCRNQKHPGRELFIHRLAIAGSNAVSWLRLTSLTAPRISIWATKSERPPPNHLAQHQKFGERSSPGHHTAHFHQLESDVAPQQTACSPVVSTLSDLPDSATKPISRNVSFFGILREPPSDEPGASLDPAFSCCLPLSRTEQVSGQIQFTAQ